MRDDISDVKSTMDVYLRIYHWFNITNVYLQIHRWFNIANIIPDSPDNDSLEPKRYNVDFTSP